MAAANEKWFDTFDLDGSGSIGLREYQGIFVPMGFSEEQLAAAFEKIDIDGDKQISRDEFNQILWDYFWSDDRDAPGNYFFGGEY
ncbi:MAG: EF-hand domain-containing protein [Chloroflexota bacterium]